MSPLAAQLTALEIVALVQASEFDADEDLSGLDLERLGARLQWT